MSRPAVESWAHAIAALWRIAGDEAPEWLTSATSMHTSLRASRADALALVEALGPSGAARALGVGRATLARWRERGQWLGPERMDNAGTPARR